MTVRLYVGNLPYEATDAELREHFSAVAPPTNVLLPLDRETGRARGFAFVDFADSALAEAAIAKFHNQLFKGRSLSVSLARPRESRPMGAPNPSPIGHPPAGNEEAGSGKRPRVFGRDALPKHKRGPARGKGSAEPKPKGPIRERIGGRMFHVDEEDADEGLDVDNLASKADDIPQDDDAE